MEILLQIYPFSVINFNNKKRATWSKSRARMNSRDKHDAVCRRARQNTPLPTLGLKAKPKAIGRGQAMVNVCCRVFFTCYRAAHFIAGLSDDLGAIFEEDRERTPRSEEYGFSLCIRALVCWCTSVCGLCPRCSFSVCFNTSQVFRFPPFTRYFIFCLVWHILASILLHNKFTPAIWPKLTILDWIWFNWIFSVIDLFYSKNNDGKFWWPSVGLTDSNSHPWPLVGRCVQLIS